MKYTLTDKLTFAENPQIEIKNKVVTVNADAKSVLKLMDIVKNKGEFEAALEAEDILFSEKDRKTIASLKLNTEDFITLISTAMTLAVGGDPDKDESGE